MEKYRAIPPGYMTVGEVAKTMGVTVRTLQYYDREELLCPTAESEGGRRLYTDKDLVRLHQILSLKSLGFSLDDIRSRLIPLENPDDVADALTEQAAAIRRKIDNLTESLEKLEKLKTEVLQMKSVDFKRYADIIVNLQMKNEYYYLIKHFDDKTLEHIRSRFDKDSGLDFIKRFNRLNDEILKLKNGGITPESPEAQRLAERFWAMVLEFAEGDMSLLPKLMEFGSISAQNEASGRERTAAENEWVKRQELVNSYIEDALDVYFTRSGVKPYEGEETR